MTKVKIRVKNSGVIKLQTIKDKEGDGTLYVAEVGVHIPFKIKRSYIINHPKHSNAIRGMHAHKKFKQVIFCLNGSFKLSLDDGHNKQQFVMDDPAVGILLGSGLWHSMTNLSDDCVIHVLSDSHYNENDYIRDYDEFLKYAQKK